MSAKPVLNLDWCSHAAATYAVEHWHYSRRMPVGKLVKIGVWEGGSFRGCILFARGNNPTLGDKYGLSCLETCELVRIALQTHETPVSRMGAIAVKMLKQLAPGLRLIVSFADPAQKHVGSIYQAMGWIYTGMSVPSWQWFHDGRWKHNREVTSGAFGGRRVLTHYAHLPKRLPIGKHRYLYPLDAAMRTQIAPLAQPYPKRATSIAADAPTVQVGEGGSTPTVALIGDSSSTT
jgi:hypothetical protein